MAMCHADPLEMLSQKLWWACDMDAQSHFGAHDSMQPGSCCKHKEAQEPSGKEGGQQWTASEWKIGALSLPGKGGSAPESRWCYNCGHVGHISMNCPHLHRAEGAGKRMMEAKGKARLGQRMAPTLGAKGGKREENLAPMGGCHICRGYHFPDIAQMGKGC